MIFPIGDNQVQGGYKPIFSYLLIAANILVFLLQVSLPEGQLAGFVNEYGSIPREISQGVDLYTLLTCMFLHGGWGHLLSNMMFLWIFADNVESTVGNIPFLIFYILGGLAASFAHILIDPLSAIPTIGASGAISACLGAYVVMYPRSQIQMAVLVFPAFKISAIFFLGFWFFQQITSGFAALTPEAGGGVAWWAHIGGFVFGVLAGFFFRARYGLKALVTSEK